MINKEVSIIVPIYNVEQYLRKCLDSLIAQTYKTIKIWAVIDGSPDNSIEIVREYEKRDSRIVCVDKENGGCGSALEFAIKEMDSPYFLVCDPDDWLEPNAVEVLLEQADLNNADITVGDRYDVFSDSNEIIRINSNLRIPEIDPKRVIEGVDVGKFAFMEISPHSKLFRTSVCKNIIFPHKVSYTDFVLFIVAISNAQKVLYVNQALSYYLCNRVGNTATDTNPKKFGYYLTVLESTMSQVEIHPNKYLFKRLFDYICFISTEYVNSACSKKEFSPYFERILKCLRALSKHRNEVMDTRLLDKKHELLFKLFTNPITSRIGFYWYLYLYRSGNKN